MKWSLGSPPEAARRAASALLPARAARVKQFWTDEISRYPTIQEPATESPRRLPWPGQASTSPQAPGWRKLTSAPPVARRRADDTTVVLAVAAPEQTAQATQPGEEQALSALACSPQEPPARAWWRGAAVPGPRRSEERPLLEAGKKTPRAVPARFLPKAAVPPAEEVLAPQAGTVWVPLTTLRTG